MIHLHVQSLYHFEDKRLLVVPPRDLVDDVSKSSVKHSFPLNVCYDALDVDV